MLRARLVGVMVLLALACVAAGQGSGNQANQNAGDQGWRDTFQVDKANLSDAGRNPYFILEPGYRLTLTHGKDTLIVNVLDETKVVDGVKTRIVGERETERGELAETSRNYFAIDTTTRDVYYFGEDVDTYKGGKVSGHEGSWLAGVNGARFGLMMPGKPVVGDKYYQEIAPNVAMDRAEIISVNEEVKGPLGPVRKNCLHTRETSAIEKGSEDKWYAPDVGLLKDGEFFLSLVQITRYFRLSKF
jgi:hypothetical protein